MWIYRWNMECYIESHCLRLFKTSRENEHQNLSSKNSAKQKSDQILFKKWKKGPGDSKSSFLIPYLEVTSSLRKGDLLTIPKRCRIARQNHVFPLFTQILWATSPCCLQKQELHGLFKEKEMLGVINFYPPWKTNMTMEMHLISRCMYLMKNGQIFHDIPCYFSGGVSCVCFFHLGARDPKIPSSFQVLLDVSSREGLHL